MSKKTKIQVLREYADNLCLESWKVFRITTQGDLYFPMWVGISCWFDRFTCRKLRTPSFKKLIPEAMKDVQKAIKFVTDNYEPDNIYVINLLATLTNIYHILCEALIFIYEQEINKFEEDNND